MKDLAVVLVTCDKNSWLWDTWYYYFRKHWHVDCQVYFCNEILPVQYDGITQVTCGYVSPNANQWTKQARECVEQIPEQSLFVIMEDMLFDVDITDTFKKLYNVFNTYKVDALRVRSKPTKADMRFFPCWINGRSIMALSDRSDYLITFSANLWDKDYLMRCLSKTQSPWRAERSNRMKGKGYRVFDFEIPNWYVNTLLQGKLTPDGQEKINEYKKIKQCS